MYLKSQFTSLNKAMTWGKTAVFLTLFLLGIVSLQQNIAPNVVKADGRTILYVDADATGNKNGTTWEHAYSTLQDALDHTNANSATAFEIWVAAGIYVPDQGVNHIDNDEGEFFTLSYDNVQLYGGFAGNETERSQRNWETNPTILSGDIDNNDANTDGNNIAETHNDITGNNSNHILYLDGVTNEPITAATVIDGFIITAGQANGEGDERNGGGLYCAGHGNGSKCNSTLANLNISGNMAYYVAGGILSTGSDYGESNLRLTNVVFNGNFGRLGSGGMSYSVSNYGISNPTLINVTFQNNETLANGGGLGNNTNDSESKPVLINVTFKNNVAGFNGGGMTTGASSYSNDSATSEPILINVTFENNTATRGGAMFVLGIYNDNDPQLFNVIFANNSATIEGGALYVQGNNNLNITNSTFSKNSAVESGSAIHIWGDGSSSYSNFNNSVFWGNTSGDDKVLSIFEWASPTFTNSIVQGSGGSANWDGSLGTDGGNNLDVDPMFVDAANGNFTLQSGSPAIDMGNNSFIPADTTDLDGDGNMEELIPFDLVGNARIYNESVDLGAYEFYPTVTPEAEALIEALIADIEQLVEDSALDPRDGRKLIYRPALALTFLNNGQPQDATAQMDKFVRNVHRIVRIGRLAPEVGDTLIADAMIILDAIPAE